MLLPSAEGFCRDSSSGVMASVLIGGDICPIERNEPAFIAGDVQALFGDALPLFAEADLVVANLEGPFIKRPTPIRKTGPTFGFPPSAIRGIRDAGIRLLGIANNHAFDHGAEGLQSTIATCQEAGIATVGAGCDRAAAQQLHVHHAAGCRVAVLAVAEREFSIAPEHDWGCNPLDLMTFVRMMRQRRSDFDHLIVLFHGAAEFHAPTPRVQETCRFLVEEGASAVIVQHPHILGGVESWKDGCIVYGQGALLMDEAIYRNLASFHEGILVNLKLVPGEPPDLRLIPFRQSGTLPGLQILHGAEEEGVRSRLNARSARIQDPSFVKAEWQDFCHRIAPGAMASLLGHGKISRTLGLSQWWVRKMNQKGTLLGVSNMVRCETHREKLETLFETTLKS